MAIEKLDDSSHPVRISLDELVVQSMVGTEAIGELFVYNLQLLSKNHNLKFKDLVGKQVTVSLDLPEGDRYFNGYITEFSYLPHSGSARYRAVVRPWLWFLTRRTDCRIFHNKTVPDIIKEVFSVNAESLSLYEAHLGSHRKWEYCVQYRETDFNFISRLMEQEGIYYYFKHENGKHTLVLSDQVTAHKEFNSKFKTIPYVAPRGEASAVNEDHLQSWSVVQSIIPTSYRYRDYNFKKPKVLIKGEKFSSFNRKGEHVYPLDKPEIYDYPGEYFEPAEGEEYAKFRMQELACQHERVQTGGPCRGLSAGCSFTLKDHPRDDQNKEYVVVSVSHTINGGDHTSGSAPTQLYSCQADVLDRKVPFRTGRVTPKPIVQGPQTAKVVGQKDKSGVPKKDDIYTDPDGYGRVKVQFHWDREHNEDQDSSCWIRVSQIWAGAEWGSMHIPRVGQEVIVSFIEGDPDRPIITGRVYNDDEKPVYTLEANKTQSGIKSRSTPGGGPDNYNEFRFEDKIGEEEITLHAEKNMSTTIENDLTSLIEHDESRNVINTREVTIGTSDNARPEEKIESLQVSGQREINISGNDMLTVMDGSKGRLVSVLNGDYALKVAEKDYTLTVDTGNADTTVSTGNLSCTTAKGDIALKSTAKNTTIDAGTSIKLTVGANSITIDKGKIELKSTGGTVTLDPSGVKVAGNLVTTEAKGINAVKGATVKVN